MRGMLLKEMGKRLAMAPSGLELVGGMVQMTDHRLMSVLVRRSGPLQQAAYHTSTPCSASHSSAQSPVRTQQYGKLDNDVTWDQARKEKHSNNQVDPKKNLSTSACRRSSTTQCWKPSSLTGVWYPEGKDGINVDTPVISAANTQPSNKGAMSSAEQAWWVSMEELPDLDRKPSKTGA